MSEPTAPEPTVDIEESGSESEYETESESTFQWMNLNCLNSATMRTAKSQSGWSPATKNPT